MRVACSAFATVCCMSGSAVSKDKMSFIALSDGKGNLGGCCGRASQSMVILTVCENALENCTGKALEWWERFHLLKNCPRDVSAHSQNYCNTKFCGQLKDVIQVVAFISLSLLCFVPFLCWLLCVQASDSTE